jgi:hypothetical protein
MFHSALLLFAFLTIGKSSSSSAQVLESSPYLGVHANTGIKIVIALLIGFAVTALLRLVKKPVQLNVPSSVPEFLSDDESSAEYGLMDTVLIVTDDETMTDLPVVPHGDRQICKAEIIDEFDTEAISD